MKKIIRQGDVGIIPLDGRPTTVNTELVPEKRRLIRRGEHGGVHQLESLDAARLYSEMSTNTHDKRVFARYIEVTEPTSIVHSEHKAVTLQPGWYEVVIQREFFGNVILYTGD